MNRPRLVVAALLVLLVAGAGLALLGGPPAETVSVSNERGGTVVVEVYQVGSDATVQIERADGTTTTQRPDDVDALATVTTVLVPENTSREAILVFPNGTASADASQTGSRFVYVVHDGDPDGRTYLAVGLVDCGDATPSTNVTITDAGAAVGPDSCE
ncbi:hypothetical protein [Halorubellus sp. PRR65]|uniref:hypothetical protein n=1 Tax=Halorubellus sp. PRR65 TaxID=3098148 RepID=UPI002B2599B0|nr:hypothetical protein [Halorubellus sp. PRR65]